MSIRDVVNGCVRCIRTVSVVCMIVIFGLFAPVSYGIAATIVSPHFYAWSDMVGYINFEHVAINDSSLSGYAWSSKMGFISFDTVNGGVGNDGTGDLSGFAWGEQLGWIDFDGVSIIDGVFAGTATGVLVGTITFDCPQYCDVQTDWRPVASIPTSGGGNSTVSSSTGSASTTPDVVDLPEQLGDIQPDGIVNILDFNALMIQWGSTQRGTADMNDDGSVDIFDFNILMVYWGTSYRN